MRNADSRTARIAAANRLAQPTKIMGTIAASINLYGDKTAGYPKATIHNLDTFTAGYMIRCVDAALCDPNLPRVYVAQVRAARDFLRANS